MCAYSYIYYVVRAVLLGVMGVLLSTTSVLSGSNLTLTDAVHLAQTNDPWLEGNVHMQQALEADSIGAAQLPDPTVSVGWINVPTDTFDNDQEPMTQLKVGINQVFPRGDTRQLKQKQIQQTSARYPYMRADRRAKVALTVSQQWLDAYRYGESIRLIEQDRKLFEQLVEVALSSYSSVSGSTSNQDVVRAQLELTRLEDRLLQLRMQQDIVREQLGEWLEWGDYSTEHSLAIDQLPSITLPAVLATQADVATVSHHLRSHPLIVGMDQKITASETTVALRQQLYKPQWGINASYGFRQDDQLGEDRADFFSIGVQFDLPLFTDKRQDQRVRSATSMAEAVKTEKMLALRALQAQFEASYAQLQQLNQRKALYKDRLLKEIDDQAEAALGAYTHDRGDFSEVVRARIVALNARIDQLNIEVDRLKVMAQINYLFASSEVESLAAAGAHHPEFHHE